MLVDDDDVSNFINEKVIEASQMARHTHVRRNGQEALDFIKMHCDASPTTSCPDVILLDIKMPVMDGFEFLQEFEKARKSIKAPIRVILLTSSSNPHDVDRAQSFDIKGYLNKPLSLEKLNEVVSKL